MLKCCSIRKVENQGGRAFSLLVIYGGTAQPIVGGAIPGLVVLGSIRKQAEKARGSKPVISTPP